MKSIAHIINKKSDTRSLLIQKILVYRVVEISNQVVKKKLNNDSVHSAEVLYFKNKIITIGCAHPTVAQELKLHEPSILKEINIKLGNIVVHKINFVQL